MSNKHDYDDDVVLADNNRLRQDNAALRAKVEEMRKALEGVYGLHRHEPCKTDDRPMRVMMLDIGLNEGGWLRRSDVLDIIKAALAAGGGE